MPLHNKRKKPTVKALQMVKAVEDEDVAVVVVAVAMAHLMVRTLQSL